MAFDHKPIFDPARVPLDIEPADWAVICKRHHRRRLLWRTGLLILLLLPIGWVGWRLSHQPPDAGAERETAAQLFERGNARAALLAIQRALQFDPDAGPSRLLAGQIHLYLGDYPRASKELRKARTLGLDAPELDIGLVTALLREGEQAEAASTLEASSLQTRAPADWLALQGDVAFALGDTGLAGRHYRDALKRATDNARALRGLARLALARGAHEKALERIDLAIAKAPRDVDNWLLKGDIELAAVEPALAETSYRAAIGLNPFRLSAPIGRSRALLMQGETELAERQIKSLAELAPGQAWTHYLRGALAQQRGQADAAIDACHQALKIDDQHAPSQLLLGELLEAAGQYEQAGELLSRYHATNPQDARGAHAHARVQMALGAPDQALTALAGVARAAAADPDMMALLGMAYLDTGATAPATDIQAQFTTAAH